MPTTSAMWGRVVGQPEVVASFHSTLESSHLSHAYLMVGAAGLGKTLVAQAIAASLMCAKGGCGVCNVCQRIKRNTHPDVQMIEPQGAQGYLAEQIRTLIHEVSLAPMEGKHKVYVLYSADLFNDSSANAFLKTLEEPPAHTTIILFAHTIQPIIPTIRSRCIIVPFRMLPLDEMIEVLCTRTGCSIDDARIALAACGNALGEAATFIKSPARIDARLAVVRAFKRLRDADEADVLMFARDIMVGVKGPVEELRQKQEADLASQAELLDSVAIKALEGYNKRRLSAYERQNVNEVCNILQSLLRDVLVISQGAEEMVLNVDVRLDLTRMSCQIAPAAIARGVDAICRARQQLTQNVSSQLAVEAMLFGIREVLECPK